MVCSVFDLSLIAAVINVAVFSLNLTVRSFRFDFETAISCLVAITVAAILVVTVDLFQNGNGRCVLFLREARTGQAEKYENLAKAKCYPLSF